MRLRQRVFANVFVVLFSVLFIQLIATVYAFAYTLSSSTTETKPTRQVFLGDFDGDADLDYVALNTDAGASLLDIYTNNGAGTFTNGTFGSSTNFRNGRVGDIDRDGDLDVVTLIDNGATIKKYINNGSAAFAEYTIASSLSDKRDLELLDIDGDGDLDLVTGGDTAATNGVYTNNGHGVFTVALSSLPITKSITSADFESDGDMDLAMIDGGDNINIYKNSGTGAFVRIYNSLTLGLHDIITGDLDADGDIDLIVNGGSPPTQTYLNDGGGTSFTPGTLFGPIAATNSYRNALGDIDSDGDLDVIIVVGADNGGTQIWLNNGAAAFGQSGTPTEVTDDTRMVAIGDIDSDFDLDYISGNNGQANRHYKNDLAATFPNTDPFAPTNLTGAMVSSGGGFATLRLSWGSGSDNEASTRLLQYKVQMGTGSNTHNIVSLRTSSPNWSNRLVPNGQSRTLLLRNLVCRTGLTYYWNVHTIDPGFRTKPFATEQTFTLDTACTLSFPGGGGGSTGGGSSGGGGGSTSTAVGGSSLRYPLLSPDQQTLKPVLYPLTVSAFDDLNGSGVLDAREQKGFAGLPITLSGSTLDGSNIALTISLGIDGTAQFTLPASDLRGYEVRIITGSTVLKGFVSTTPHTVTGVVLPPPKKEALEGSAVLIPEEVVLEEETAVVSFGLRRADLLHYAPCLDIALPLQGERRGSDSEILLQRLIDPYGLRISRGLNLSDALVTRREFLTLLQRIYCIQLQEDVQELVSAVSKEARRRGADFVLPLIDLPILPLGEDSRLMHSLLGEGLPVSRKTTIGSAADLSSPMSRREALFLVEKAMAIPEESKVGVGELTVTDIAPDDPLASTLLTLSSLHILPGSFVPILGADQGITPQESALLLIRSAFRAGRISLLHDIGSVEEAAVDSSFLSLLPEIKFASCLKETPKRAENVHFNDSLPGSPFSSDVRKLLELSLPSKEEKPFDAPQGKPSESTQGKSLWLLPGTLRPSEFGIERGETVLLPKAPVSVIETLRALLILSCIPPYTRAEVTSGDVLSTRGQGTAESRIPRDRISNLPRDASLASRILYRAQDHGQEFDLFLFTYATHLLSGDYRPALAAFTTEEASDLFASTLLSIAVRSKSLLPHEADARSSGLRASILAFFLEKSDIIWRTDEGIARTTPLTREQLLKFLSTVTQNRRTDEGLKQKPIGQLWWERVR